MRRDRVWFVVVICLCFFCFGFTSTGINNRMYYPDASVADQGGTTGRSVKNLVDAIGGTAAATIVFTHSSSGNTTTYSFGTAETIPDNITVVVDNGARISGTLAIDGSFIAGSYQCFDTAAVISFGIGSAPMYFFEWFGAVGDGVADDHAAIKAMTAAYPIGANIVIRENCNYLINTAESLTFARKIILSGAGNITIGAAMGQRPALIFSANNSQLTDFGVIGDLTNFTNADTSTELRRMIRITGNNVICYKLGITYGIFGIEYYLTTGGSVKNCYFNNPTISVDTLGTYPNQNYCQALRATGDCFDLEVADNKCIGWGEFVTSGQRCQGFRIIGNVMELQGDNGAYVSGANFVVSGNICRNQYQAGIKGYLGSTAISNNCIYTTGAYSMQEAISVSAQHYYVAGPPKDAHNNTSHNIVISNNTARGHFTSSIIQVLDNPTTDWAGISSAAVSFNELSAEETDPTAASGCRGITYASNMVGANQWTSFGCEIIGNLVQYCNQGINVNSSATGYHDYMIISDNTINACEINSLVLYKVKKAQIHDNIVINPISTAFSTYGVYLSGIEYCTFSNNYVGNTSGDGGGMDYAFYEVTGNDYNHYINNRIEGIADESRHYQLDSANSKIVITKSKTATLTGHTVFYPGQASDYFIDPTGNRNFNPSGQFTIGYKFTLVNLADAAETITVDSTGLNQPVARNERGIFIYNGTNWIKIYVGS